MKRLKSLAKGPIADNHASMVEVCTGVDLLPFQWKPTDDDVDVHMIAIATDTVSLSKGQVAVKVNDVVAKSPWNDDDTGMRMQEPSANDHDHGFGDDDYTRRRHLSQRRKALTSDVSEKSWTVYNAPLGFCDGSAQSTCNRNVFNSCLLSNHNYYRAGIIAHGKSGKLSLSIPSVKEGIVLARFDWDLEGGPCVESLPADFRFEYTVNGKKNSLNRNEFTAASKDITGDLRLHALLMDHEMSQNRNETKTIDIELEVVSAVTGVMPLVLLSHIYYA